MRKFILLGYGFVFFLYTTAVGQSAPPTPRVQVPDIDGMAVSLVKPAFPETAAPHADGSGVALKVAVDENGNVISAQCSLNCHPLLKDAAELAAATSKFRPLINKEGQAIPYEGILHYTFVIDRVDWYRFGTFFESVRQFDNISLGPSAGILSAKFASEKARLVALDAKGVDLETRWKVMREVEASLKEKLKGGDLWRFEIGMALRLVTFWTMAGERTNRADLQTAIDNLPKIIAAAPDDIPGPTIEALRAVSKYRVPADLPERELRQVIANMTRTIIIQQ
jgi:hypothetical protein